MSTPHLVRTRSRLALISLIAESQRWAASNPLHPSLHSATPSIDWYEGYGNTPSLSLFAGRSTFFTPDTAHIQTIPSFAIPLNGGTSVITQEGPFAWFFHHDPKDQTGYGGATFKRTITSALISEPVQQDFKGPWSSRCSAMNARILLNRKTCPHLHLMVECRMNCCSGLNLPSAIQLLALLRQDPLLFTPKDPSKLTLPSNHLPVLLVHMEEDPSTGNPLEIHFTPALRAQFDDPNDNGLWVKGEIPAFFGDLVYIIEPFKQHTPLRPSVGGVQPRPIDSIIPGRMRAISTNTCMPAPIGCGGPATTFRDDLSRRDYTITALCQACQDKIYTPPAEDTTDWDDAELKDEPNSGVDLFDLRDVNDQ